MENERAIRLRRVAHVTKLLEPEIKQVQDASIFIEQVSARITDRRNKAMLAALREEAKRQGIQQLLEIDKEDLLSLIRMNTAQIPIDTGRGSFLCPNFTCQARVEHGIHPHYCGTCGQAIQWK